MTENLLQKLEEKVTLLLTQLETLRAELSSAKLENATLLADKADSTRKLQGLISLIDSVNEVVPVKNEYVAA